MVPFLIGYKSVSSWQSDDIGPHRKNLHFGHRLAFFEYSTSDSAITQIYRILYSLPHNIVHEGVIAKEV